MSFLLKYANSTDASKATEDKPQISFIHWRYIICRQCRRPDLREEAKKYAALLYQTYHQKIVNLPENTLILPAHFNVTSIALKHAELISETIGLLKKKINYSP